jgi:Zn-dependent M28 family amino/carboxypeptidase
MRPTLPLLILPLLALSATAGAEEDLAATYREPASRILGAALTDEGGWEKLTHLTTVIGHRLSGSAGLEQALEWAHGRMLEEGLENVHLQPVKVPYWVRGHEEAEVLTPVVRKLDMIGLGRSVGTPAEGITAPAVVVRNWEDLEALGREGVTGRIVVYAVPWEGYSSIWPYRAHAASRAAALGAVGVLVRSATGRSLGAPHTGAMRYDEEQPQIPAAAVTLEDAHWLERLAATGDEITIRMMMEAQTLPDADSFNLMAEIRGSELPDEIVVMGGHSDSWDVGEGAHDDGAGIIAAWQALTLIHDLGLRPRRTLRVVFWTNEENGVAGGDAYREMVGDDIGNHVAAIEMDGGAEKPVGFGFGMAERDTGAADAVYEEALTTLLDIAQLLDGIEAGEILRGGGGVDIGPLMKDGVPGLGLRTVGEHYFDWHHTRADTLDKVDKAEFQKAIGMLGIMGFALADMPGRLAPADWQEEPTAQRVK